MAPPSGEPISIQTQRRLKPVCPRCASEMILIGRLVDDSGGAVRFAAISPAGLTDPMGTVRACYCNDCGELTLTIE